MRKLQTGLLAAAITMLLAARPARANIQYQSSEYGGVIVYASADIYMVDSQEDPGEDVYPDGAGEANVYSDHIGQASLTGTQESATAVFSSTLTAGSGDIFSVTVDQENYTSYGFFSDSAVIQHDGNAAQTKTATAVTAGTCSTPLGSFSVAAGDPHYLHFPEYQ